MILYLDASALFKLCVEETDSGQVRAQLEAAANKATAWIAYTEIRAALAMARRLRRLSAEDLTAARARWESHWNELAQLALTERRCREAGELAETYGLRSFDSLHLACYAHLARSAAPEEVRFCCFDRELAVAAARWRREAVR